MGDRPLQATRLAERLSLPEHLLPENLLSQDKFPENLLRQSFLPEHLAFVQNYIMVFGIAATIGSVSYIMSKARCGEARRKRRRRARRDEERAEGAEARPDSVVDNHHPSAVATAGSTSQSVRSLEESGTSSPKIPKRTSSPSARLGSQSQDISSVASLPSTSSSDTRPLPQRASRTVLSRARSLSIARSQRRNDAITQRVTRSNTPSSRNPPAIPPQSEHREQPARRGQSPASAIPPPSTTSPAASPASQLARDPQANATPSQNAATEEATAVSVQALVPQSAEMHPRVRPNDSRAQESQATQATSELPTSTEAPATSAAQPAQAEERPLNKKARRRLKKLAAQARLQSIAEAEPLLTTTADSTAPPESQPESPSATPPAPPPSPVQTQSSLQSQPRIQPDPPRPTPRAQRAQNATPGPSQPRSSPSTSNVQTQTTPEADVQLLPRLRKLETEVKATQECVALLKVENKNLRDKQLRWKGIVERMIEELRKKKNEDLNKLRGWITNAERLKTMTKGAKPAAQLAKELKDVVEKTEKDQEDALGVDAVKS
ncbi:hypothetical protein FRC02_002813 [Tulasnella sp. 418]|nr:hypothetical protein FRC02_002813 [Tulasnella sp. 418]